MGSNIHLVIGPDDFLVEETVRGIYSDATGLEVIDSISSTTIEQQLADIGAAHSSLLEPPFLFPRKTTWWKNVHFLPSAGKKSCAEEVKESLERFAGVLSATDLPDGQLFILSAPSLLASSVFAKTLKSSVSVTGLEQGGRGKKSSSQIAHETEQRVVSYAEREGLTFSPEALAAFIGTVGPDARSQINEIGKMRAWKGTSSDKVEVEDVEAVTSPGAGMEPSMWGVSNAIADRNAAAAVAALREVEDMTGAAVVLTGAAEKCFRQLAAVKDAKARGRKCPFAVAPWQFDKMCRQAERWSLAELRMARHRMAALREGAVSGMENAVARLEIEINRACVRGGGKK